MKAFRSCYLWDIQLLQERCFKNVLYFSFKLYVCVYICVCTYVCTYMCVYIYVCVHMSVCVHICVSLSTLSLTLEFRGYVRLSVQLVPGIFLPPFPSTEVKNTQPHVYLFIFVQEIQNQALRLTW